MFSSVPQIDLNALKPQEWISKRRETLKPWTEFASFSKFKKPTGVGQGVSRLVKNVDHFQSNYLFVFIFSNLIVKLLIKFEYSFPMIIVLFCVLLK